MGYMAFVRNRLCGMTVNISCYNPANCIQPVAAGSPDEWLPENVAAQLYLCGDSITVKVLTSKALNGRTSELSAIFLSLCLVCVRQRQSLNWIVNIVRRVCSAVDNRRDRRALLRGIVDAFQAVILDLHDFSDDYGMT
jgi:hypothetical protein